MTMPVTASSDGSGGGGGDGQGAGGGGGAGTGRGREWGVFGAARNERRMKSTSLSPVASNISSITGESIDIDRASTYE